MNKLLYVLERWSYTPQGRKTIEKAGKAIVGTVGTVLIEAAPAALPVAAAAAAGYGIYRLVRNK